MRTKLLLLFILLLSGELTVYSQLQPANNSLSNLGRTLINQDLVPDSNNGRDLGSKTFPWRDLHFGSGLYFQGERLLHSPGLDNIFLGKSAGNSTLTGSYNTATGYFSLLNLTSGKMNAAYGHSALYSNTTGSYNTATGHQALYSNSIGAENTAVGYAVLYHNKKGVLNTAVGSNSMLQNTSGQQNTAVGAYSLFHNTTGLLNTANGSAALLDNTTGHSNVAIGSGTMSTNVSGNFNTAVGHGALFGNDTGSSSTALGTNALYFNRASNNTATGHFSMYNNTTGTFNTANGLAALYNNRTGNNNTASGYQALFSNSTGNNNTAFGFNALHMNVVGSSNTAIGQSAAYNTRGSGNTAYGARALLSNSTGNYNTAVGYEAFAALDNNGSMNIGIGVGNWIYNDINNSIAIGYNLSVGSSNTVRIGSSSTTSIGGWASWSTFSDGRYKRNVQENITGLAFINKLRPVSYTVDVKAINEYFKKERGQTQDSTIEEMKAIIRASEEAAGKIVWDGFVAQEVEATAKELKVHFSGVDKPEQENGLYGLRYDHFVVPLVKAVQELSKKNDSLQQQNNDLLNRIERLEAIVNGQSTASASQKTVIVTDAPAIQQTQLSDAALEQNIPNPFGNSTTIPYTLPQQYATAQIIITNPSGKKLKQVTVSGTGKGVLTIDASTLSGGVYQYSLIVNGKLIGTRSMVLAR